MAQSGFETFSTARATSFLLRLFCFFVVVSGCGAEPNDLQRSFQGETRCTREASFDCDCVILNSPQHQQATGTTILKCPFHENFEAAIGHEYCLNKDPATGGFRSKLAVDGCPWKDSTEETNRLLSFESL